VIVGISTGEIFSVHTIGVLVRPLDFKPPITITITIPDTISRAATSRAAGQAVYARTEKRADSVRGLLLLPT
jgi:hypothetical protein